MNRPPRVFAGVWLSLAAAVWCAGAQEARAVAVGTGGNPGNSATPVTSGPFSDSGSVSPSGANSGDVSLSNQNYPTPQDSGDGGFSINGPLSVDVTLSNGATTATLTFTITDNLTVNDPGYYQLFTSTDVWLGGASSSNTPADSGVQASVLSATANLLDSSNNIVTTADPTISPVNPAGSNALNLPYEYAGAIASSAFYVSATSANPATYTLEYDLTAQFSNLQSGDTVYVDFPGGASLDPAPEPSSLVLFALGAVGVGGFSLRRRKRPAVG